jgi:hypothetical protein
MNSTTLLNNILIFLMLLTVMPSSAFAQAANSDGEKKEDQLDPKFAAMSREVGFVCGEFLPSQIPGINEMMALCGGHVGIKVGDAAFFEPELLSGAGHAQRYIIGSASFRGDIQMDDFVVSSSIGADIHYATQPTNLSSAPGEQTNLYFGGHVGAALWWEFSQNFALRTDMQFYFNPGTSLFVGIGVVMRFAPEGQSQAGQTQ